MPRKGLAEAAGFALHAGIGIEAEAQAKLERLCRYVSRPAVAEDRLALTERGDVRLRLKTPYRDGTTHIVMEPLDCAVRSRRPGGAAAGAGLAPSGRCRNTSR